MYARKKKSSTASQYGGGSCYHMFGSKTLYTLIKSTGQRTIVIIIITVRVVSIAKYRRVGVHRLRPLSGIIAKGVTFYFIYVWDKRTITTTPK